MKNLKIALAAIIALFFFESAKCQDKNPTGQSGSKVISTATPFLTISPDARGGSMGDAGVASSPDAGSMYYNAAKYAFIEDKAGLDISYTPWLRKLVNDINLFYLSGYYRIDDMSTVAASLTYFSLGDIVFTSAGGIVNGTYRPAEFAFTLAYARKFTDHWSGSISFKYINSNLTQGQADQQNDSKAGNAVAADLGVYYQNDITLFNLPGEFAWGLQLSNMGNKISYSERNNDKYFLPANFRIGPRVSLDLDDYNRLSFMVDFNKLMVPTPDHSANPEDRYKYLASDISVVEGMLQSFYKAPGGFSEKISEVTTSFGVEYLYNNVFALRGGYFYESKDKGNRKYFTLGAGLKYNILDINFSYLIPQNQQNPLENTVRFSLVFNLPK
ncbi:MAG: type IX secretion system outer membrane channel protein PorV [Bacteroidales bacterium]